MAGIEEGGSFDGFPNIGIKRFVPASITGQLKIATATLSGRERMLHFRTDNAAEIASCEIKMEFEAAYKRTMDRFAEAAKDFNVKLAEPEKSLAEFNFVRQVEALENKPFLDQAQRLRAVARQMWEGSPKAVRCYSDRDMMRQSISPP